MEFDNYLKLTGENIEDFQEKTSGFHSCLVKEIHLINSSFRQEKVTRDYNNYNVKLLIQCHDNPVELILIDVRNLNFAKISEVYGGTIEMITETEELFVLKLDDEIQISCSHIYYRIQNEFWGNKVFLNGHIPTPDMSVSSDLGDNWRQCVDCGESWNQHKKVKIDICPSCNNLTELKE